jgi:hypothetical protein
MRITRTAVLVVGLSFAGATIARATAFHLHLEKSEPADKSEVAKPPTELRLWFGEPAEVALTKLTLASGRDTVPLGKPTKASDEKAPIVAKIVQPLTPRAYTVSWRTMGKDGHAVTGTFVFTLRATAPGRGAQ